MCSHFTVHSLVKNGSPFERLASSLSSDAAVNKYYENLAAFADTLQQLPPA